MSKANITDTEVWKPIPNTDGTYEASTHGRIRSAHRVLKTIDKNGLAYDRTFQSKVLAGRVHQAKYGYFKVHVLFHGKRGQAYIHQLIADTFIGSRPDGCQVNHKDGNKFNNRPDNLEYITPSENNFHAYRVLNVNRSHSLVPARITMEKAEEIRRLYASGVQAKEIAIRFGISRPYVYSITSNRRKHNSPL